jgi:hypothetical protein
MVIPATTATIATMMTKTKTMTITTAMKVRRTVDPLPGEQVADPQMATPVADATMMTNLSITGPNLRKPVQILVA